MSLSRRIAARSARMLGVTAASAALVFSAAGGALASNIKDFSAAAVCDGDKGVITVTDKDPAGTPAVVSVFLENNGADLRKVGELEVQGSKEGVTITFEEDWEPGAIYRIHVTAGNQIDEDITPNLTAPSKPCKSEDTATPTPPVTQTPSEPTTQTPSQPESEPATPTPSTSTTTPPTDTAINAPSPAGESNLAETGAGSNTGLIIGIAATLVTLGATAVIFAMRRRGTNR
ncbi:LAETG motif-containing sortase-dependent surface protein [Streptomyces sp. NPDC018693]|uniref:LAETG motif-containing sortase-dependent surface protein n=1 Tax=unclassified Streptomyces TaxID=2593676 RepID=UPI0037A969F6